MENIEIKTINGGILLFVDIYGDNPHSFELDKKTSITNNLLHYKVNVGCHGKFLPKGNWLLIGELDKLTTPDVNLADFDDIDQFNKFIQRRRKLKTGKWVLVYRNIKRIKRN